MATICQMCDVPVAPEDVQPGCAPGVFYHRFCYPFAVAHIEAKLEAYCAANGIIDAGEIPAGRLLELWRTGFCCR